MFWSRTRDALEQFARRLEQLQTAYDLQVLPEEQVEDESGEPSRLLVAIKKRGFRGPRRVEITYAATSGEIRQLRFVEMPYGPDRITIRMTLVGGKQLDAAFFEHDNHHDQHVSWNLRSKRMNRQRIAFFAWLARERRAACLGSNCRKVLAHWQSPQAPDERHREGEHVRRQLVHALHQRRTGRRRFDQVHPAQRHLGRYSADLPDDDRRVGQG